jgi:hypothetical protein
VLGLCRAVAAATGRGFKSYQPDGSGFVIRRCGAYSGACVRRRNQIDRQAFAAANASIPMAAQTAFPSMHFPVAIVGVLIGVVILLFGRKLFWLCVAAAGFAVGAEIAPQLVHQPSSVVALLVALVFGVLGALLALFLQKVAIAVLGFLAGGYVATAIAAAFFVHHAQYSTIVFIGGGIIGAILLLVLFGWALIVVSSLIGAHLIQSAIVLPPTGSTLVFVGLAIVGIFVQAASFRRSTI